MAEDKEYSGTMMLGVTTSTQDKDGEVIERREVPPLDERTIRAAFEKFRGDFYQTPPMVSAIKQAGVPLYKLARQGKTVEREPRLVHIYRYSIDRVACQRSISLLSAAKAFMFAPTRTTSERNSAVEHIFIR